MLANSGGGRVPPAAGPPAVVTHVSLKLAAQTSGWAVFFRQAAGDVGPPLVRTASLRPLLQLCSGRRPDLLIAEALLVGCDPILGDFLLGLIQRDVTGTDMRVEEVLKLVFDVGVPVGALIWLWPEVRLLV